MKRLGCAAAALCVLAAQPKVEADGRVTFRLAAPGAKEVKLWGEWIPRYNTTEPLKRSPEGEWTATLGPIAPNRYHYLFLVDGLAVPDPKNPAVVTGHNGFQANELYVPAPDPPLWEIRAGGHGILRTHAYNSSTGLGVRRVVVYTPPGYTNAPAVRYPVLYLLHGSGDTESSLTGVGRAHIIADNLITTGRMRPMILVMPNGHADGDNARARVEQDLIRDVIPLVESQYRVVPTRVGRAIAGLSMGAFQAMWFAMDHPDLFSALGILSGGIWGEEGEADVLRYARQSTRFRMLSIAVGERDMNSSLCRRLDSLLTTHSIDHDFTVVPGAGHNWQFWRPALADLLPRLSISFR